MRKLIIIFSLLCPLNSLCQIQFTEKERWHKVDSIGFVNSELYLRSTLGADFFCEHLYFHKAFESGLLQTYLIKSGKDSCKYLIACHFSNRLNDRNDVTKNIILDSSASRISRSEIRNIKRGLLRQKVWLSDIEIERVFLVLYPAMANRNYRIALQRRDNSTLYYVIYVPDSKWRGSLFQFNATTGKLEEEGFWNAVE